MNISAVSVIGLGLIGGSLAKAIKAYTPYTVAGYDADGGTLHDALSDGAIDCTATAHRLAASELIIIGLYAEDTIKFVKANMANIRPGTIVCDLCGVKRYICSQMQPLADAGGFCFVGCHPMAGKEISGYAASESSLFEGASMILTPSAETPPDKLGLLRDFFAALGFGNIAVTTPEEHDRIIAFTSQLAHIISSAYIKSPTSRAHEGFSAGSYRDLTRVARMNEKMWAHHFMLDRDNLINEIDTLTQHLAEYRSALEAGDEDELRRLIIEGTQIKLSDK